MGKKIQLSTVRQEADVEVVFVNAALICKVINACNAVQGIIDNAIAYGTIRPLTKPKVDENGNEVTDANGCVVDEPIIGNDGKQTIVYQSHRISEVEVIGLNETVLPFLAELRKALEGE